MTEGYYYRPRIDDSILEKYGTEGLIASSACFLPSDNLDVLTKDGIKNLLDVQAGDYVQSHTGKWCQVIIPTTREYEGNFYKFTINGELPFTITENHKLLILRKNSKSIEDKYDYLSRWNIPYTLSYTERARGIYEPEWLEAKNINVGDDVLIPVDINIDLGEVRQYILSQEDKFEITEAGNYCIKSQDKNYLYDFKNKLQSLLIMSWLYDKNNYYELNFWKKKIDNLKNNEYYPLNEGEVPFEFNGKLYIRRNIFYIDKFYDKKQVYCLNVENDHSFVINNIISRNCLAGSVAQYILKNNYDAAKKKALYYQQLFNGNFYLEMMCHLKLQEEVNKGLIQLHKDTGIPLIISSDAHYLNKEDRIAHDILLCTQQKTTLNDPNRWKFEPGFYYIMGREELTQIMHKHHPYITDDILNKAMDNTVKIAEQCHVEFTLGKHYLPKINPYNELKNNPQLKKEFDIFESRRIKEITHQDNLTVEEVKEKIDSSDEYIRFLTIHGYHGMYQQHKLDAKHLSLLFYELDVIYNMQFSSYFLILEEIIRWCAEQNIPVGVARGCCLKTNKVNTGLDDKYHQVLQTYEYDCDEDLIQIETENNKIIDGLTKDHKVLGLKKEDYVEGKEYTINDLMWYEIDELDVNDYIVEI